jgi:hypothetical protein
LLAPTLSALLCPDSIHSPNICQPFSPDSIHSTDICQPFSPDSIHSTLDTFADIRQNVTRIRHICTSNSPFWRILGEWPLLSHDPKTIRQIYLFDFFNFKKLYWLENCFGFQMLLLLLTVLSLIFNVVVCESDTCDVHALLDAKCSNARDRAKCRKCVMYALDHECPKNSIDPSKACKTLKKCLDDIKFCSKSVTFFD